MSQFAAIISDVATYYWGPQNPNLSSSTELRFGTNGSKSVDVHRAIWFDHERGIGGSISDLISDSDPNADVSAVLARFGLPMTGATKVSRHTWTYYDQSGSPRFRVVRFDDANGKRYFQQHYTKSGVWARGLGGMSILPYRLPELLSSNDTIFLTEGEKCADSLFQLGLTATTNPGGAGKWPTEFGCYFIGRNIVILPDNDEPGRKHGLLVASRLNKHAASIKVLHLPYLKQKEDVFDWLKNGGTKEELLSLAEATPLYSLYDNNYEVSDEIITPGKSFNFILWSELKETEARWLVDQLIPKSGLSVLFGKPGTGKTFWALLLAASIGAGKKFFGREVVLSDVVYLASEGSAGLKLRCDAIHKVYKFEHPKVFFLPIQLDLQSNSSDCELLVKEINRHGIKPALIIVDTLSRAFGGGDENSSASMGSFIGHITNLQQQLNTAVLLIHHSGKSEDRGARGHSSLNAAADAEFELQRLSELGDSDRHIKVIVKKQKDGEDGLEFFFRLDSVQLGLVDASKTSLVVVPTDQDSAPSRGKRKKFTGHRKTAFEALKQALRDGGEKRNLNKVPNDRPSVTESLWRHTFYAMCPSGGPEKRDSQQRAFHRASQSLIADRTVGFWADFAWIPDS